MVKFTLRDLFSLVVVVAMGLAWWQTARRERESRLRLEDELAKANTQNDLSSQLLKGLMDRRLDSLNQSLIEGAATHDMLRP